MRWLVFITLGFAAGCGCCIWLESGTGCLAACLVLTAAFGLLCSKRRELRVLLSVFLGLSLGQLWYTGYSALVLAPASSLDGKTAVVAIRAADDGYETDYGMAVDGRLDRYPVRVYLEGTDPVCPGEILSGPFRFRTTLGTDSYHSGEGTFLLAYQAGELTRTRESPGWQDFPALLRRQIKTILQECFAPEVSPFARALLLGDTSGLSYREDWDLKVSGIRHVAAVSGLHVSILFALISTLTLRRRFFTALAGFPALLLFAALAGFTPSVTRSCIMCGLMLLALVTNRQYDGPTALAFAVLAMLLVNPLVLTSVGFQLSVASVAGIYCFQPRIQRWLLARLGEPGRILRWFSSSVSVTFGAMVFTTPLCAWYFGMVSLISPLTNLLTLWVISIIFYGILGVCLLSLALPGLVPLLAGAVSVLIRYVLWMARTMADFPLAAVYTVSPYIIAWVVFTYGLLLLGRWGKPRTLGCCAALGLCISLAASWAEPRMDDVRFTVLDVGQGQCLLFQAEGRNVLVDCGGSQCSDQAARTLLSQGYDHLDMMILTHMDRDHAGGAEDLLSVLDADMLILPPDGAGLWPAGQTLYVTRDLELTLGDTRIQILAPQSQGNTNEMSLCVLFDTEKCDILITGDRTARGEQDLLHLPRVDVLVAGHHGSAGSTSQALLDALNPQIVCISAGENNPYGHPAPALLRRLAVAGCRVYRTDLQGTITIRR